jgi:hypothetical protein
MLSGRAGTTCLTMTAIVTGLSPGKSSQCLGRRFPDVSPAPQSDSSTASNIGQTPERALLSPNPALY